MEASHIKITEEEDQIVTPWKVLSKDGIDYMKLIRKFGCKAIDGELIKRFENVTNVKAHHWLRRGIYFSHKDLDRALDEYEKGNQVYLYTGRGPSERMHLGHMIPFMFTKYLQDAFDAILVIQMSDDEKFHFKTKLTLDHCNKMARENAKDIIACGFNLDKTFIFSNLETVGGEFYKNVVKIMNSTTGNQVRGIFGLNLNNSLGQLSWPAFQAAPAFSNSFSDIIHPQKTDQCICLVPMAIDQDPYFRMARNFGEKMRKKGYYKPAVIHTRFLVALSGINAKMSSTGNNPTIYMVDKPKQIRKKINKHAFSGGYVTLDDHRKYGGNLDIDVSYQYLFYFEQDDEVLKQIAHDYVSGKMTSGEIKKVMADVICKVVEKHQKKRAEVTDEVIAKFFKRDRKFNLVRSKRKPIELESDYSKYGIIFDSHFGAKNPNRVTDTEI